MNRKQIKRTIVDTILLFTLTIIIFILLKVNIFNFYFLAYLLLASIIVFCTVFFTIRHCRKNNINLVLYKTRIRVVISVAILLMPIVPLVVRNISIDVTSFVDFANYSPSKYPNYKMKNDIDLANEKLTCEDNYCYYLEKLDGYLNGNGYSFKNAKGSIFKTLKNDTINNLTIEYQGEDIYSNFGVLAIYNSAQINRVTVKADIKGGNNIGGLVYNNTGTITSSAFIGSIEGNNLLAGISVYNTGKIVGCEVLATITGNEYVAGFNCIVEGELYDCYLDATLKGKTVGALVNEVKTYLIYDKITKKKDLESLSMITASICLGIIEAEEIVGELTSEHFGVTFANIEISCPTLLGLDKRVYVPNYETITVYAENYMVVQSTLLDITKDNLKKNQIWYVNKLGLDSELWKLDESIDAENLPRLININH